MKLYYFAAPGRAEASRVMLRYAEKEFEDVTFDGETWASTYKTQSPSGQAPYLELDDGELLCQSGAIESYVASVCGFMPDNAFKVFAPLMPTFAIKDEAEKIAKRKEMIAEGGSVHAKMAVAEKLVAGRSTKFYLSDDEPTYIDIYVFTFVSTLMSGMLDGITKDDVAKFSACMELRNSVASVDKIAKQYADAEGIRMAFRAE